MSYNKHFAFALGWLWNPAATAVLCPPSKGLWMVFECPITGRFRAFLGDELSWRDTDSSALQPGAESLLWSSGHPHWEVLKPVQQRCRLTWDNSGLKDVLLKKELHQCSVRPISNSKQVIPHGLGIPHSSRVCPFPSDLGENLNHLPVPLDRCVQQEAPGEGQGMCEMLGVSGCFWLNLCLLQVVKW